MIRRFASSLVFASGLIVLPQLTSATSADGVWDSTETAPASAPSASPKSSARNRLAYVGYQTLLSSYVYGLSIPLAYGVDEPRVLIAAPLITAPLAFGVHLWLSRQMELTDAQLMGMSYFPVLATYSATALPMAFTSDFGKGYQIGSILGAVAYPLGLWYGHYLGDAYRNNPGQLDTKLRFAVGYLFLGFVTPTLYFEHPSDHSRDILRAGLGQSVGLAILGHEVADFYRTGPDVPSGVPLGIATHALLGGLAGLEFAALADANSARPWTGAAVLGTSLGFTGGVFFFYPSHDSRERALYSLLGGVGGTLMGSGLELLLYDKNASASEQKAAWATSLIAGAWLGYWATYLLTSGMVESPRHSESQDHDSADVTRWAFNPFPAMEATHSRGELAWRWKVPGVSYRF